MGNCMSSTVKDNEQNGANSTSYLNKPGKWDYFISHVQKDSSVIALEVFVSMEKRGKTCWLDVKMEERDEAAMKEGIKNSKIILVIMSPMYFTRPFCVKELEWAVQYGKLIQVIIDVQLKGEIGNIIGRCPAEKSYLKDIGGINFTEVFRGNPDMWEASIKSILKAKPKILTYKRNDINDNKVNCVICLAGWFYLTEEKHGYSFIKHAALKKLLQKSGKAIVVDEVNEKCNILLVSEGNDHDGKGHDDTYKQIVSMYQHILKLCQ